VVIYLDVVMVYSKKRVDHPHTWNRFLKDKGSMKSPWILRKESSVFQKEKYWGTSFLKMGSLSIQNALKPSCKSPYQTTRSLCNCFLGK
jgi:hypothetical protein